MSENKVQEGRCLFDCARHPCCIFIITRFIQNEVFPGDVSGKEPTCQCRKPNITWVWSLSGEDPLEEDMATHFSILAWTIPWTENGLWSMGSQSRTWLKQLSTAQHTHRQPKDGEEFCLFGLLYPQHFRAMLGTEKALNKYLLSKWMKKYLMAWVTISKFNLTEWNGSSFNL